MFCFLRLCYDAASAAQCSVAHTHPCIRAHALVTVRLGLRGTVIPKAAHARSTNVQNRHGEPSSFARVSFMKVQCSASMRSVFDAFHFILLPSLDVRTKAMSFAICILIFRSIAFLSANATSLFAVFLNRMLNIFLSFFLIIFNKSL